MTTSMDTTHSPLVAPPLPLPLKLRVPWGLFGMARTRDDETITLPSGDAFTYSKRQFHTGVDLLAPVDTAVFAARRGKVMDVTQHTGHEKPDDDYQVVVNHTVDALAFSSRYLHLRNVVVAAGDRVAAGQVIGFVGNPTEGGWPDHLHFELRKILHASDPNKSWWKDNTEVIDPTPFLYRWEKIYYEQIRGIVPQTQSAAPLQEVGMIRRRGVPFFQVRQDGSFYVIPLYCPNDGERALIEQLTEAYAHNRSVRLATRDSFFFQVSASQRRVITAARLT